MARPGSIEIKRLRNQVAKLKASVEHWRDSAVVRAMCIEKLNKLIRACRDQMTKELKLALTDILDEYEADSLIGRQKQER